MDSRVGHSDCAEGDDTVTNGEEGPPGILRLLRPADYVTLFNAFVGLAAVVAASREQVLLAYELVLATVLLDGVDGAVARRTGGGGPLGPKLDTLADLIGFVVAPGVLVYTEYFDREVFPFLPLPAEAQPALWTHVGVLVTVGVFVAFGVLRLARFDWLGGGGRQDVFHGLTTPGGAIVVVALALFGRANPDAAWVPAAALAAVIAAGLLMISRRLVPKLRGPLVVPSIIVIVTAMALGPRYGGVGALLLLAFSAAYVLFGPVYVRSRGADDGTRAAD